MTNHEADRTSDAELLAECRHALGYTKRGLANFLVADERVMRRREKGEEDIPPLLWLVLFYMLRDNVFQHMEAGEALAAQRKRELMNQVHKLIQQRRPG